MFKAIRNRIASALATRGAYFDNPLADWNASQLGLRFGRSPKGGMDTSPVYACVQVFCQEIARLNVYHYIEDENGRRIRQKNTAVAQLLHRPHPHMSRVDWLHYMQRSLLTEGNGIAIASRDQRGAVRHLIPQKPGTVWPYVVEDGDLWYRKVSGLDRLQQDPQPGEMVAARDVFHIRGDCPNSPLIGETPLKVAALEAETGRSIAGMSNKFFSRGGRPSGILRLPNKIGVEQRDRLVKSWTAAHGGENAGGTAVLDEGADYQPITINPVDADVVRQYQMTVEGVARVFRVPLFMLGDLTKATMTNVEQLTRTFYNGGLGYYVRVWETALERFFELPPGETIEFDVEGGLLRDDFKGRMEASAKGVQGGILTPNEARAIERRAPEPGGDTLLVQQQMVPIGQAGQTAVPPQPEGTSDDHNAD